MRSIFMCGALLLLLSQAALAAAPDVRVQLEVVRVDVAASGASEGFASAGAVHPGDLLEYRARYVNHGDALARDVEATLPIPADGVVYVADSARPRNVLASIDGKRFETIPLKRTVTLPDGRRQTEMVPLAEYRYLRWKLGDLAAGRDVTVVSRVRLNPLDVVPVSLAQPQAAGGATRSFAAPAVR